MYKPLCFANQNVYIPDMMLLEKLFVTYSAVKSRLCFKRTPPKHHASPTVLCSEIDSKHTKILMKIQTCLSILKTTNQMFVNGKKKSDILGKKSIG